MLSGSMMGNGYEIPLLGAVVASALVPSDLLQLPAIFLGAMLAEECKDYYRTHTQEWEKDFRAKQIRSAHTFMGLVEKHKLTGFLPVSYNGVPEGFPRARTYLEFMFGLSINPAEPETLYNPYFIPSDGLFHSLYVKESNVYDIPQSLMDAHRCFKKIAKIGKYEHDRRIGFAFLRMIDKVIEQVSTEHSSFTYMHVAAAMGRVHMLLNETLRDYRDVVLFEETTAQFLMTGQDPSVTRAITGNNLVVPKGIHSPLSLVKAAAEESMEKFISNDIPTRIEETSASMKKSAQQLLIAVAEAHGLINKNGQTSFTPEELAAFTFKDNFKTELYRTYLSRLEKDGESVSVEQIAADFEKNANTPERKEFARFLAASYVVNRQIMCQENIVDIIKISGSLSIPEMLLIFDESYFAFADQVPAIIRHITPVFNSEKQAKMFTLAKKIKATAGDKFTKFKSQLESIQNQMTILHKSNFQRARNDVNYLAELERKVADVTKSFGSKLPEKKKALLQSQIRIVRQRIHGSDYVAPVDESVEDLIPVPEADDKVHRAFLEVAQQLPESLKLDTPKSSLKPALNKLESHFRSMKKNFRFQDGLKKSESKQIIRYAKSVMLTMQEKYDRKIRHFSAAMANANPEAVDIERDIGKQDVIWMLPPGAEKREDVKTLKIKIDELNESISKQLTLHACYFREMAEMHRDHLRSRMTCSRSVDRAVAEIHQGVTPQIISDIETAAEQYRKQCEKVVNFLDDDASKHEFKIEAVQTEECVQANPDLIRARCAVEWMEQHSIAPSACIDWWNNAAESMETNKNRITIDFVYSMICMQHEWNATEKQQFLRSAITDPNLTVNLSAFQDALRQQNTGVWLLSHGFWFLGDLMLRFQSVQLPLSKLVADTPDVSLPAGVEMRSHLAMMFSKVSNFEGRNQFHTQKNCTLFASTRRQSLLQQNRAACPGLVPVACAG